MMLLLRLAARNMFRHTRRTVMTVTVIVVAIGVLILGQGFIDGLDESIVAGAIGGTIGHVMAVPADYPSLGGQHPIDELLTVNEDTRALLNKEAEAWTERIMFTPTLIAGNDSLRVRAIAYDPVRDPQVFPRNLWHIEGEEPVPGEDQIMVARGVASLLQLGVGDMVVAQTRTHQGAINAMRLQVSGIYHTKNMALDVNGVLLPTPTAAKLISTTQPSHLLVRLVRRSKAAELSPKLAAALGPQAKVSTWQEETADLVALQNVRRQALNMLVFVLMLLAAFGIANTILMAAYERVRELGTLRAMGMTGGGVITLFLWEGVFMGLLGGALGAAWGGALALWWSASPIDMTEMLEGTSGAIPVTSLIYTRFDPTTAVFAILFGVAVATVASVYPARTASNMSPAAAIRNQ